MKLEGRNPVNELLKSDKTIDKVLVQNGLRDAESQSVINLCKQKKVKLVFADKNVLDKESEKSKHQGFIAFTSEFVYSELPELVKEGTQNLIIILDGVEDVHNLGSIIRVCECAGASGIVIPKHRAASVTDKAAEISEGAVNFVKIARVTNINDSIDWLKKNNFFVYGCESGGQSVYKTNLTGNVALVIGSEGGGVKRLTREKCDLIITIPMQGKINNLNASVACGVAVFEAVRQRTAK